MFPYFKMNFFCQATALLQIGVDRKTSSHSLSLLLANNFKNHILVLYLCQTTTLTPDLILTPSSLYNTYYGHVDNSINDEPRNLLLVANSTIALHSITDNSQTFVN